MSPATTLTLPKLGLGVYEIPVSLTAHVVEQALTLGYRLIDSAQLYRNERETCEGIATYLASAAAHQQGVQRDDIIYTTKIWDSDHGYEPCTASIARSVEIAKAAGLGHIDLLLLHSPYGGQRRDTWRAMEEALASGDVKAIGVSNFGIHHLKELLDAPDLQVRPAVNQLELSPWLQRAELVAFCRAQGIVVEAYAPLTQGNKLADPQLQAMAAKYGRSPAQVLIRWSIQKGFVPLPKSVRVKRLKENFMCALTPADDGGFELTEADMAELGDVNAYEWFDWDPTVAP